MRECIIRSRIQPAFLPQEGFLDLVLFGFDWWNSHVDMLNMALEYHEGLQYLRALQQQGFAWPSVEAQESDEPGAGDLDITFRSETPLHQAGYMIRGQGNRKIPRARRWIVLQTVIATNRISLQDVADTIANHIRLRKLAAGGTDRFQYAIQEWEYDLAQLRNEYYAGKNYAFRWPNAEP